MISYETFMKLVSEEERFLSEGETGILPGFDWHANESKSWDWDDSETIDTDVLYNSWHASDSDVTQIVGIETVRLPRFKWRATDIRLKSETMTCVEGALLGGLLAGMVCVWAFVLTLAA